MQRIRLFSPFSHSDLSDYGYQRDQPHSYILMQSRLVHIGPPGIYSRETIADMQDPGNGIHDAEGAGRMI